MLAASPNWLGSPQHFVAGLVLTLVVFWLSRRFGLAVLPAAVLAVGVTSTAEILVELVEYPFSTAQTAYYDTLADLANTLAGAVLGAAIAVLIARRRSARR